MGWWNSYRQHALAPADDADQKHSQLLVLAGVMRFADNKITGALVPPVLAHLLASLSDDKIVVRNEALTTARAVIEHPTCAVWASGQQEIVGKLIALLGDESNDVRLSALRVIKCFTKTSPHVRQAHMARHVMHTPLSLTHSLTLAMRARIRVSPTGCARVYASTRSATDGVHQGQGTAHTARVRASAGARVLGALGAFAAAGLPGIMRRGLEEDRIRVLHTHLEQAARGVRG